MSSTIASLFQGIGQFFGHLFFIFPIAAIIAFAQGYLSAVLTAVVVVLASLIHLQYRRSAAFRIQGKKPIDIVWAAHEGDVGRIADHLAVDPTRVRVKVWEE
jgi:hypothetical protein